MSATRVVVWVSSGTSWGAGWRIVTRLIPEVSDQTEGSMGRATFRMLRGERNDGTGDLNDTWYPTRGQYIAIARSGGASPFSGLLWCGVVTGIHPQPLQYSTDVMGEVEAVEVGSVLAQTPVANLRQGGSGLGAGAATILAINPPANIAGANGEIIGNMGSPSAGIAPFEALPDDIGTGNAALWKSWHLLTHVLTYAAEGTRVPTLALSMPSSVATYLQTAPLGVVELDGLSIADLINVLVGPTSGFSWKVIPNAGGWTINVQSGSDIAIGSFPAATAVTAELEGDDTDLTFDTSGADVYDAVEVIGAAHVFGGTVSLLDGSAGKGWTDAAQATYLTAASGTGGYAAMTPTEKWARNRAVRRSAAMQDVFSRIELRRYTPYTDLYCKGAAGVPAGTVQFLTPLVSWDGTTATISANSSTLYLPTARILRQLPWPSGKSASGTDNRTNIAKAQPTYLSPVVLRYTLTGDAWVGWSDLLHPPSTKWPIPTISVDDRGPAVRIEYDHPETLARGYWSGAAKSEFDPDLTTSYGATDYAKIVMTVAVESGQRVKARVLRSGISEGTVRNVLRIERPDLHYWCMRGHSILGIKADGTPDETTADTVTRNDYPIAQRHAEQAAAFAFRQRTAASITVTDPANPPSWAEIGALISNVTEDDPNSTASGTHALNTVVRGIRQTWNPRAPRLTVTTDYPTAGRGAGGGASVALGGTQTAAIQRARMDLGDVARDVARMPISPGAPGTKYQPGRTEEIEETAHGFVAYDWVMKAATGGAWALASRQTFDAGDFGTVGLVLEVIDADNFVVALDGYHYLPSMTGNTAFQAHYLDTFGNTVTTSPDTTSKTSSIVERMTHLPLPDSWIWIPGSDLRNSHNHRLSDLADVLVATTPADGDVMTFDLAQQLWKPAVASASLGSRAALSVIGRAANSVGVAADIAASTTGDVLQMGASALQWGQLQTASYAALSVTAAKIGTDVVLDTLADVTIASVADLDFVRYDLATTQWKNHSLGKIAYVDPASAIPVLALDGGGVTGQATMAAIGANGSRFLLHFASGSVTTALDFVLSGDPDSGTEKVARIRTVSATEVGFYDQGTASVTAGTKVASWVCDSVAANRLFRYLVPVQVGASASDGLTVSRPDSFTSTFAHNATDYLRFENAVSARVRVLQPIVFPLLASITETAGPILTVQASGHIFLNGNVRLGATVGAGGAVGFFGVAGNVKIAVADQAALATTQTSGATYTANEQTMLTNIKADLATARNKLNELLDALQAYNLV